MIKMPKDLLAAWLADLRSGNAPQSKGRLRTSVGYCCLGRLQIVAGEVDVEKEKVNNQKARALPSAEWLKAHNIDFGDYCENPDIIVPVEVADRINLSGERSLAGLNDEGVKFKDIADIIEANAEGV